MSTSNRPLKVTAHYEALVLGGRLSGWIAAQLLHERGLKVGLVHKETEPGQEYKILSTPFGPMAQGVRLLPNHPQARAALKRLAQELALELPLQAAPSGLQTLEGTAHKSFVGFGDKEPDSLPVLEPYLAPSYQILATEALSQLVEKCQQGGWDVHAPAEVTGLEQAPEGGWLVEIDHKKTFLADRLFYVDSPHQLHGLLLVPGVKPSRDLRSLSRWRGSTSLSWTLVHRPTSAPAWEPWLVPGLKHEPTLGVFEPAEAEHQVSHWVSFLPADQAASEEFCAMAYREMKRQLKKVHPELGEEPLWEKISVLPLSHGHPGWEAGGKELKLGKELYLMGSAFSTFQPPLWAELISPLEACERALEQIPPSPPAEISP